jgi:hypothetical protein
MLTTARGSHYKPLRRPSFALESQVSGVLSPHQSDPARPGGPCLLPGRVTPDRRSRASTPRQCAHGRSSSRIRPGGAVGGRPIASRPCKKDKKKDADPGYPRSSSAARWLPSEDLAQPIYPSFAEWAPGIRIGCLNYADWPPGQRLAASSRNGSDFWSFVTPFLQYYWNKSTNLPAEAPVIILRSVRVSP